MALNYVIVVDDAGELKTVTAADIDALPHSTLGLTIETALNSILDQRAIAAGEYTPEDDAVPIVVTVGGKTYRDRVVR